MDDLPVLRKSSFTGCAEDNTKECNALSMDVQKTLKLKDVIEEDEFTPFMSAPSDDEDELEE